MNVVSASTWSLLPSPSRNLPLQETFPFKKPSPSRNLLLQETFPLFPLTTSLLSWLNLTNNVFAFVFCSFVFVLCFCLLRLKGLLNPAFLYFFRHKEIRNDRKQKDKGTNIDKTIKTSTSTITTTTKLQRH